MTRPDPHPKVVAMPTQQPTKQPKTVPCTQAAIDALPLGSGDWVVKGVPGLLVRCGARGKSFRVQRRIRGRLVKRVLGKMSVAAARREAMKLWAQLKPAPLEGKMTLAQAWHRYLEEKTLAAKTRKVYAQNLELYLADWKNRTLESLGQDRAGFRTRILQIARQHGKAAAGSLLRTFRAIYNYHRRVSPDLPECPSVAVDEPRVPPRDWALSDKELRAWWRAVRQLGPLKRTWWLTALLTGARAASLSHLKWEDVDFERKVIRFRVAKGGRSYRVPMSERLALILLRWREQAVASQWVFASPRDPSRPLYEQVRDDRKGVLSPHHLRHTMRTQLAEVGATSDLARIALGHSMTHDVSQRYVTPQLLVEAVRPLMNAVAEKYAQKLGWGSYGATEESSGSEGPAGGS